MGYCRYRKNENGEIESRRFDSEEIPDGWVDSPAVFKNNSEPVMENPPEAVPEHTQGLTDVSDPVKTKKKRRKKTRGD